MRLLLSYAQKGQQKDRKALFLCEAKLRILLYEPSPSSPHRKKNLGGFCIILFHCYLKGVGLYQEGSYSCFGTAFFFLKKRLRREKSSMRLVKIFDFKSAHR